MAKGYSRVVLVLVTVVLVVQLLGLLLGVVLGALAVDKVQALGLDQLVDLEADGRSQQLLGGAVVDRLALPALLLLPQAHALEGGRRTDQLVRDLGLVRLAVVDLVARVLGFACAWGGRGGLAGELRCMAGGGVGGIGDDEEGGGGTYRNRTL